MSTPAPAPARILAQARFDTGTLLRNGEQLLVSLVLPLLALLALAWTDAPSLGEGRRIDLAVPGVLALAVLSTAFTGQAISTGFDRRYGVLRLLGVTPLGRTGLLGGRVLAVVCVLLLQVTVLGSVGLALGWRPAPAGLIPGVIVLILGTLTFVCAALLLAGSLRAEAVLALANLIWVLLLAGGGVILPADRVGGVAGTLIGLLPSAALGDGLRTALVGGAMPWASCGILLVWMGILGSAVRATFRWSD